VGSVSLSAAGLVARCLWLPRTSLGACWPGWRPWGGRPTGGVGAEASPPAGGTEVPASGGVDEGGGERAA